MIVLGLTGSIGMGKSTAAQFFAREGIPVYSADRAVHMLYRKAAVVAQIGAAFPGTVENGVVDREKLAAAVLGRPAALGLLESLIHPHVHQAEAAFLHQVEQQGHRLAVLDIPLLFETGGQARMDYVAVVSAPFDVQKKRVLRRPGMTEQKFAAILARQMPDEEKRKRAHFVIDTAKSLAAVHDAVRAVIKTLCAG